MALASCATTGPSSVYSEAGIAAPATGSVQYPNANLLENFRAAAQTAQTSRTSESYKQFMRGGFALIYARCNAYFDEKGNAQATSNLVRSSIAPIAALVTGIFSLHNYKSPDNAERDFRYLSLGSSTAVAALDVYTENFLFGAENIESVREMTREELSVHAGTALEMNPRSLEEAALQIIDNQVICTPSHILKSTRTAIANERFRAAATGSGINELGGELLGELGAALGLTPPIITETQAGMLYAVTMGYARQPSQLKLARAKLGELPEAANPIKDNGDGTFAVKQDYPFADLKAVFAKAPPSMQAALAQRSQVIMRAASVAGARDIAAANAANISLYASGEPALVDLLMSSESEYILPLPGSGELRRVRVESRNQ